MKYSSALVALLLTVTSSNAAVQCREAPEPNSKAFWRWRLIDGKKCWHASREVVEKPKLQWVIEPEERVIERKFYTHEELEQMLPKDDNFDARWPKEMK